MNPGEALSYDHFGEEVFRVVSEFKACTECGKTELGLVVAGRKGVWWICGACNAYIRATRVAGKKPLSPKLVRVK